MKKVSCRSIAGKRYQVSVILMPNKIETTYELVIKSKNLEQLPQEEQETFRKMESEIIGTDADFTKLEEELDRL